MGGDFWFRQERKEVGVVVELIQEDSGKYPRDDVDEMLR